MRKLLTAREGRRLLGAALVLLVVAVVLLSLVQTHGLVCVCMPGPVLLVFALLAPVMDVWVVWPDAPRFRALTVGTTRSFQLPPPLNLL